MVKYFFDSYAIIELVKGNPSYARFSDELVVITIFNLVEIYWSFVLDFGEEKAKELYLHFKECVVPIPDSVIQDAITFRKENKRKNLSYADCLGYIYARQNNLLFLTGDKEFQGLEHVVFVK